MEQQIVSSQPTPGWLQSALENQKLGAPNTIIYKDAFSTRKLFWWVIALLVIYGLTAFITGLAGSSWTPDGDLIAYAFWSTNLFVNILQGAWIVLSFLALLLLVRSYFTRHQYLCLYPQELLHCTRAKTRSFQFERIQYLWCNWVSIDRPLIFSVTALRLRLNDGSSFHFDQSWGQYNSERDTIERDFVSRHLPALLEQFDRGDAIDFLSGLKPYQYKPGSPLPAGSVRIGKTSVSNGNEVLAWDMVERFQIGEDLIQIWKRGKVLAWYNSAVSVVPNACLLRELARERALLY